MTKRKTVDKKRLNLEQRKQVEEGLLSGLPIEAVALYGQPEFDRLQMDELRRAFEAGLTVEEVKVFAKPELSWFEMMEYKNVILAGKTLAGRG